MGKLTDAYLRQLVKVPRTRGRKHTDGDGLFVRETTDGLSWQLRTRGPREDTVSLGTYPDVSVAEARKKMSEKKRVLAEGRHPNETKRKQRQAAILDLESPFEVVAREWLERKRPEWSKSYHDKELGRLKNHVFRFLRARPIRHVQPEDMLEILERIQKTGAIETAHRVFITASQVFEHAIRTRRMDSNPCAHLRGTLRRPQARHMAAITDPKALADYLRVAASYSGRNPVVGAALRLLPLVFLRSQEFRLAEWKEIDLTKLLGPCLRQG
jgi:hypothetical protein